MIGIRALTPAAMLAALPAPVLAQDAILENWTRVTFEEVVFESPDGARIAGSLFMPVDAPQAALVLVNGSSAVGRMNDYARLFATKGLAVLTYDRRGARDSGGALPGARVLSPENLDLLAADAEAAMTWLAARPETQGLATGFFGTGHAGWIVPPAAVNTPATDFVVMWSATAMTVSAELEDGLSLGEDSGDADATRAFIDQLRRDGTDPDPAAAIAAFGKPSLWIYGTEDQEIPVADAIAILEPLSEGDHPEITLVINEGGEHGLDLEQDRALFEGMVEWMLTRPALP